jgi:hypothetical protein
MADAISKLEYYTATIANKPGEGARVLGALREAGVNLTAFFGYKAGARKSEIICVVEKATPEMKKAAKKAGLELSKKQTGFFVHGEDRPGAVADIMGKLGDAGINVHTAHAICAGANRYGAFIVVDADDVRKAGKALGA